MRARLSVDFQNTDEKGRVRLNTRGTLTDIERLGLTLTNGMDLLLLDGELETEGVAAYSEEEQIWVCTTIGVYCATSGCRLHQITASDTLTMGLYSVVTVLWQNPHTKEELALRVQFKYGDTRLQEYRLGDELRWGGNDVGARTQRSVVVDGVLESADRSPGVPEDFEVFIVNNRITDVRPATGRYDFSKDNRTYIVLQE